MPIPWESFLARYRPLARNLAAGITGRASDADDLVQEAVRALLIAVRRDETRFDSLEHARNYFLASVRNLAMKSRERTIPMQTLDDHELHIATADLSTDDVGERQRALAEALSRLSRDDRELVRRRFSEHETLRAIADSTGLSISTLHSREKAILERLRRALERGGDRT